MKIGWTGKWPTDEYPPDGARLRFGRHGGAPQEGTLLRVWCGVEPVFDIRRDDGTHCSAYPTLDDIEVVAALVPPQAPTHQISDAGLKEGIIPPVGRVEPPTLASNGGCESGREASQGAESASEPIPPQAPQAPKPDWTKVPKQCTEFRVIDIGEYDRCEFITGHDGRHSFEAPQQETKP